MIPHARDSEVRQAGANFSLALVSRWWRKPDYVLGNVGDVCGKPRHHVSRVLVGFGEKNQLRRRQIPAKGEVQSTAVTVLPKHGGGALGAAAMRSKLYHHHLVK